MSNGRTFLNVTALAALLVSLSGCHHKPHKNYCQFEPVAPLGTISDPIWQQQEENAEASDFVVHEHEFVGNTTTLNAAGEDHVKQIASRLSEVPFPVVVQQSSMTIKEGTVNELPVHGNLKLDMARRELVVRSLAAMGVDDAEKRVVVGPALAPGFTVPEANAAYTRGFSGFNQNRGGFGGGFW